MIGDSLQACRNALESNETDQGLHLVERINIDLSVQNSIVPSARSLTRFKVSGNLPALQVNFSDTKYKSLMRLIDVAIPHFGGDSDQKKQEQAVPSRPPNFRPQSSFQLSSGLFGQGGTEYNIDEDDDKGTTDHINDDDEHLLDAEDGTVEVRLKLHSLLDVS